ncbi:T/G mismatch-specific endonuclease [Robiginitalea myxolifaciens]|uniref:Very short patch repair endonuclease n=1 Tax=Robiginitalea myxolifaciens TaxID=400055 RepID=A0A1I6G0X1_9FLAO|nr:DNA mismatch endonuclease Vsr [Robiginitalea myxolifaciens]SFR35826.1 T/G mismatch-specific endonuclease [Robiginitalea myxolifaciens]
MADVHSAQVRSYNMSRIRSMDSKPEMIVRRFLHGQGFRYSLHKKGMPGNPDLVLRKYNTVIFVHGCFWHGHKGCPYFKLPETRKDWWKQKLKSNQLRDGKNKKALTAQGWNVITVWECELKPRVLEERLNILLSELTKSGSKSVF